MAIIRNFPEAFFDLFPLWCFVSLIMLPGGGRNSLRVHFQGSSGDRHASGVSLGHEKHAHLLIYVVKTFCFFSIQGQSTRAKQSTSSPSPNHLLI